MAYEAPPFAALRTLEAAYRRQNYTQAGEDLGITHSAVSQTVRRLETAYGLPLFTRHGGQMTPTPATAALVDAYLQAVAIVDRAAASQAAAADTSALVVSTPPATARLWFAPRLARLRDALGDLKIELRTTHEFANLDTDGVDVAIRYGDGDWPGLRVEPLFDDTAFPVASPGLIERCGSGSDPRIAGLPLIHGAAGRWEAWFAAAEAAPPSPSSGLTFDDEAMEIEAAAAGLGVVLARPPHAQDALAEGRLVRLSNSSLRTGKRGYMVWRADSPRIAAIRRFADWLIDECGRSGLLEDA